MTKFTQLVVFSLDEQLYALPLAAVERIVRAAELTPLPKAPAIVLGVIDVAGRILPVLNVRQRLRLPRCEINPAHQFLIANTTRRSVVLAIDEAMDVIEVPADEIVDAREIVPMLEQIRGVVKLRGDLVLIHDLEEFLSLEEERALEEAMTEETSHGV
ncbi:MAG TPA: chemotaxis protein CheW [Pyrinomonadaceae bacterium]|jgi:purine-binding chemotaxis protein CheW|nr:chemotaxis protein CheW [Pyrinomonadaceae bacterium]